MRIFFIARRVPYPPDRGDKITTFNELRHLARTHEVHVFCLADGLEDLENVAGALRYAREVTAVPVHPLRSKLRALLALANGTPLSVAMMAEPVLRAEVVRRYAELRPELMFVYSSNVAQFAEPFTNVTRIMQFADLDSLKWTRYAESTPPPMKWVYALEGRRLLRYERRIARSFTHSLVCTEVEKRDFEEAIPDAPVSIVGNGVDLEHFRSTGAPKKAGGIVFTGVMDYFPNVDAVEWFCTDVLPRIRREMPDVSFVICGSRPNATVQALGALSGVRVTGRVPDVRPYLDSAEIFVAPLRIARGIQNKVLEAMAMGLPVVSSVAAWRGTGISRGEGIEATDDAAAFAGHVVRLLREPGYRAAMSASARRVVERDFSWDAQMAVLSEVISWVRPPLRS